MGRVKHFSTDIVIKKKRVKKGNGFGSFFKGALKKGLKKASTAGKKYGASAMSGLKKNVFTPANMQKMKTFATEQLAPMAMQQMQQFAANNETLRNSPFSSIIQNPDPFIKMGKRFLMPSSSTLPLPGPIAEEGLAAEGAAAEGAAAEGAGGLISELLPMLLL